jgi:hypothetical protein
LAIALLTSATDTPVPLETSSEVLLRAIIAAITAATPPVARMFFQSIAVLVVGVIGVKSGVWRVPQLPNTSFMSLELTT